MSRRIGTVLVDTNAILECHRTRTWPAFAGGYSVETTVTCVQETQTGFQLRSEEESINEEELRDSLKAIHAVGPHELAALAVRLPRVTLDAGEEELWAHTLTRNDDWIFCGPDRASLRAGFSLGFRDRLISLEELLSRINIKPSVPLLTQYKRRWHGETLTWLELNNLA